MSVPVRITWPGEENLTFDQSHVILVEGADDQAVIKGIIEHEGLDDFLVIKMGGKDSWSGKLRVMKKDPTFEANVTTLGLMRDADQNPNGEWDSCADILKSCGLPTPGMDGTPSTEIMIVPSRERHGAIEELCLDSLDEVKLACVDSYFACLGTEAKPKGRLQAYLAGLPGVPRDLTIAVSQRRHLDMGASAFNELRAFVRALAPSSPADVRSQE
jgi:hypothetical protein